MKIILDENLPHYLKKVLSEHDVATVYDLGWSGVSNGELIGRIDGVYDVLLTADKNLRYQQDLTERGISIIELYSNRLPLIKAIETEILGALTSIEAGSCVALEP